MRYTDEQIIDMLFQPAMEMASIGYFGQKRGDVQCKTGFKVTVTSDGHPQSHMHIYSSALDKRVCVKMTKAAYFAHDKWPHHFTRREAEQFDAFLRTPYKYPQEFKIGKSIYKVETYWDYAIYQWKLENDVIKSDDLSVEQDEQGYVVFPEQPDYTKLA